MNKEVFAGGACELLSCNVLTTETGIGTGTGDLPQLYHQWKDEEEEDTDLTGDSGIGESGYSSVETWRQAIKNPPPGNL